MFSAPRHSNRRSHGIFKCLTCDRKFYSNINFQLHLRSEEHDNMLLAIGIDYYPIAVADGNANIASTTGEHGLISSTYKELTNIRDWKTFPPFYYCVLCNESFLPTEDYAIHLRSYSHTQMIHFMQDMCSRNTQNVTNCYSSVATDTLNEMSPDESINQPTLPYCEICQIQFCHKYEYERHQRNSLHIMKKSFLTKMLGRKTKWNLYVSHYCEISGKFRNSLYYCELCNILFHDMSSYQEHLNCSIHDGILQLMRNLFPRINQNIAGACYDDRDSALESVPPVHYCTACNEWVLDANVQDDLLECFSKLSRQVQ